MGAFFDELFTEALAVIYSRVCLKNKQTNPESIQMRRFFFPDIKNTHLAILPCHYKTAHNLDHRGENLLTWRSPA